MVGISYEVCLMISSVSSERMLVPVGAYRGNKKQAVVHALLRLALC